MKLSKATRAAGLALAAAALIAPTAANGELWWFDHKEGRFPVSTLKKVVEPSFLLVQITDKNGKKIHLCDTKVKGEIYSKYNGMGEGTLDKPEKGFVECATDIKECTASIQPLAGTPWSLTLKEKEEKVTISNLSVKIKLEGKCEGTALPEESTVTGTVEGTFINFNGSNSAGVALSKAKIGTNEVYLDGEFNFGTELTALPEPKGFTATSSPAKIDGEQTPNITVFTRASRTINCQGATLSATAENGATEVTVTPVYSGCTAIALGMEYPTTVKMNGCQYVHHLHSEATGEENYKFTAPTDVKCPAGKEIEVDVFSSHSNHTAGTTTCRFKLGETGNQGLNLIELENRPVSIEVDPTSWMLALVNMDEIDSKRVSGSALICGPEFDTEGTLQGEFLLKGTTDPGGKENGIAVHPG